jgi:hypothetical protein
VRRIAGGLLAFFVLTGTFLILPVYAAPVPQATPVAPSIDAVDMGSVDQPTDAAVVTDDGAVVDAGPAAPVDPPAAGQPEVTVPHSDRDQLASSGKEIEGVPALTVSRPHTDRFESVGVSWAEDPGVTEVSVQLRVRHKSGDWGRWTTVTQDDVALETASKVGKPDVRGGTAPYWTGDGYGVEVIVQAPDGTTPRDVQVSLIDPGTSPADAAPGAPAVKDEAHAAMTMPAIYSRAQWGADESLMGWDPEYAPTIQAATVHHTADSNNYTAADVPAIMRSIYAYHAVTRGWGDIGYNVIVDKFGRAWEGRAGGLASTVIGAHAGGFNTATFGVSMLGNYDLVDTPKALLDTVARVIAWKLSLYGVDPKGTTTLTSSGGGTSKYAAGVPVTLPTVFAHRDVGNTACPGKYGYSHMDQIRSMVAADMANPALQIRVVQSFLRNGEGSGPADVVLQRGDPGDVPVACDLDGNGSDAVGVFRRGRFILFDSNNPAAPAVADFWFGDPGDTPLCGDWDGDGHDSVGVWRKGWFYLRNSNATGVADGKFPFGNVDAQPVVGDWNGDTFDTVGVFQLGTLYHTDSNLRPVANGSMPFGIRSDRAVAGDWTGSGRDSFGVFRGGVFYLANQLDRPSTDQTIPFGDRTDRPLVGDWNGNGTDTVGVTRGY